MNQLAYATAQAVVNLAKRIGVGELAEKHRDQLRPAAKTLGASFRVVLLTSAPNSVTGKCWPI
jgi:hypothetical protein